VLPLVSRSDRAVVRECLTLRERSNDPDLSARSIEGFIAAKALVRALERSPRLTPQAVSATLDSLNDLDVGGHVLDFSRPGRTGSRCVDFAMLGAGGKVVQ
jgi:hypothetical protein